MAKVLYSDISNNFELDEKGDLKIVSDEDAVVQSVENRLLTMFGERPNRARWGSALRFMLFERITEANGAKLADIIYDSLENEQRWEIEELNVIGLVNEGAYRIKMTGYIPQLLRRRTITRILRYTPEF